MVYNTNYEANKGVALTIFLGLILAGLYFSSFVCQTAMGKTDQITIVDKSVYNEEGQQIVNPSGENVSFFVTGHNGHFIWYYDDPDSCYWIDDVNGSTYGPFNAEYMWAWIKEHGSPATTGSIILYYFSSPAILQVGGEENRPALIHIMGEDKDITYGITEEKWNILSFLNFFWGIVTFSVIPFPFNVVPTLLSVIILFLIGYFIWCNITGIIPSWI